MVILAAIAGGSPRAEAGKLVFVRAGRIYEVADDGKGEPVASAELPAELGEVRFLEARGDLLVVHGATTSAWLKGAVVGGTCPGVASPSPKAQCLVCDGKFISADGKLSAEIGVAGRDLVFRGASGYDLVALTDDGVIGWDRRKKDDVKKLAEAGALSHLVVAPDGDRAAAVFGEGEAARIKTFLLDGKGTPRQLGGPGIPLIWSADSTWVLTQEGIDPNEEGGDEGGGEGRLEQVPADETVDADRGVLALPPPRKKAKPKKAAPPPPPPAPRTRVCAVRATGGEAKCWDDYIGLGFSPDSTLVLMRKGTTLYVGKIAGVRPEPPVKRLDGVDGAATWVEP